jgi:hypothetical protein
MEFVPHLINLLTSKVSLPLIPISFIPTLFIMIFIFHEWRWTHLMARIPPVGSLKWNTTSPCMASLIANLAKLRYSVLYLDHEHWKWWKWHHKLRQCYVAWTQFITELYDHFDTNRHSLYRLTKLK